MSALRLGPVYDADAEVQCLLDALGSLGWKGLRRDLGEVNCVQLPASATQLTEVASPSVIKNARYCRRRLEKTGAPVEVRRYGQGEIGAYGLAEAAAVEMRSWVAAEGGELKLAGEANQRFWAALTEARAAPFEAVVWTLRVGGAPVAYSLHIETHDTVYIVANGYDEAWKVHSPGGMLSLDILQDACARGKKTVDWGLGDSGYKEKWGARPTGRLFDVLLFRPGVAGQTLRAAARLALRDWQDLPAHD
jgi:CelD/BcsL family acetyltransferase involved in cellulose biosynthesis